MVTRRQHFVPQFYLKGFASGGKAWAARKGPDGRFYKLPKTSIANLCSRRDCYEVKSSSTRKQGDFVQRNSIEGWLSKLERSLALALRNVTEAPDAQALEAAMKRSLRSMRFLLVNLIVRNPTTLDSSREASGEFAKALISDGLLTESDVATIEEMGFTPKDITEYSILKAELQSLEEGSPMDDVLSWLNDAGAIVLRAKAGAQFVTAEIPFAFGWDNSDSELPTYIFFPLDWRTAVVFHKYSKVITSSHLDVGDAALWNQILIRWNEDSGMVIAKSERVLQREICEYNDSL